MKNLRDVLNASYRWHKARSAVLRPALHPCPSTPPGGSMLLYEILTEANAIIARCSYGETKKTVKAVNQRQSRHKGTWIFALCCAVCVPALAYCVYRVLCGVGGLW